MKNLLSRVLALSALTALALGFSPISHAEEILRVKKSAARCESPQVCINPSYDMTCSFQDNGTVLVSKVYITNMAYPALPIPAPYAFLNSSDLSQLKNLLTSFMKSESQTRQPAPGRTYSLSGNDYASSDRYVVPAKDGRTEDSEIAMYFRQFGEISTNTESEELVQLADKYCNWVFLSLKK